MTPKEAIRILMLSPCYWRLNLAARKELVREYCTTYDALWARQAEQEKKRPA